MFSLFRKTFVATLNLVRLFETLLNLTDFIEI